MHQAKDIMLQLDYFLSLSVLFLTESLPVVPIEI